MAHLLSTNKWQVYLRNKIKSTKWTYYVCELILNLLQIDIELVSQANCINVSINKMYIISEYLHLSLYVYSCCPGNRFMNQTDFITNIIWDSMSALCVGSSAKYH